MLLVARSYPSSPVIRMFKGVGVVTHNRSPLVCQAEACDWKVRRPDTSVTCGVLCVKDQVLSTILDWDGAERCSRSTRG